MDDEIIKTGKDPEKAKSIVKMVEERNKALSVLDPKRFTSIVVEGYYEVIKELITALMAIDGYKTLSHIKLLSYLKDNYNEFSEYELKFLGQLRKIRNNINYGGFSVSYDYLERSGLEIRNIINKLKKIIKDKL